MHYPMTSKITPEARQRCAAHTLAEQLAQLRGIHTVETARLAVRQKHDMQELDQMLEADQFWGGRYARLSMPIGGAD